MKKKKLKISLVLVSKDEEKYALKFFESLEKQTRKPDEIILVDSSEDKTPEIAKPYIDKLIKIDPSVGAKYRSSAGLQRNIGVENSTGDIIVFTDIDCVLHEDWLEKLTKPFRDTKIKVVQGQVFFHSYDGSKDHGPFSTKLKKIGKRLNHCNTAYRKHVLEEFPLANDIRWDDVELSYRISKKYRIYGCKEAKVYHYAVNFEHRDIWTSALNSGVGWAKILLKYKNLYWVIRIGYNILNVIRVWGPKVFLYYVFAFFYSLFNEITNPEIITNPKIIKIERGGRCHI